jgi:RNA-directed DNA polymerase
MIKAEKYRTVQMSLLDEVEWIRDSPVVTGLDVFEAGSSKVSRQWLSGCKEEQALAQDLMDKIVAPLNLVAALRQVVRNGGSPGIDGMTVGELKSWFSSHYQELAESLRTGSYRPSAVREVKIPKAKGGYRTLGIPTVKDRLVQQSISQVLSARYERIFSASNHGYRPKRGAHSALKEAGQYVSDGNRWVVDIDLEKFFDTVNHDRLVWLLGQRIGDKTVLKLIVKFLHTGVLTEGVVTQRVKGTPQGSPLSPLLSNIILDELDKELERRGHNFVRYADDLIVMVGSEAAAKRVKSSLTKFIESQLRLKVNQSKSRICRPEQLNFLGHTIFRDGGLGISKTSVKRFKTKLKELTRRNRGISLERLVRELNQTMRGWLNYFKHARLRKLLRTIESWLNRRIRCFRLKQCKRALGIARFLQKLGVPKNRSWTTASASTGWYRKAFSPAAHEGMNLQWFRRIGLFSLSDNYRLIFKETAQYDQRTLGGVRGR